MRSAMTDPTRPIAAFVAQMKVCRLWGEPVARCVVRQERLVPWHKVDKDGHVTGVAGMYTAVLVGRK